MKSAKIHLSLGGGGGGGGPPYKTHIELCPPTGGGFSTPLPPPPPSPFTLAKKRNEKTFQLWPLKLATFPKKISGNILGKFGLCQIIQQYDARLRQIKLCPKAGNDEYIVLSNFISCSMSGFEVIEEALWSPSVTRSERKKKKKDPCESG